MPPQPTPNDRAAYLLADEYLSAADDRFLPLLATLYDPKRLVPIVEKWKRDGRPWARAQVSAYLLMPLDHPGHEPVVKRLFRHAESIRDDEVMGWFLAAFDRLIRRRRKVRHEWDRRSRTSYTTESLTSPRDTVPKPRGGSRPYVGRDDRLFSYHTRQYLRRRAWRYFRRLGFGVGDRVAATEYVPAICHALRRYTDADLATGEALLDCWGLMHAAFGGGDVLTFGVSYVGLADGRGLGELAPTPMFEPHWQRAAAAPPLLSLVVDAAGRPVRTWAVEMLRRHHAGRLASIDAPLLLRMLDHADPAVQQFGAELLETSTTLGSLTVADWLRLLRTRGVLALESIARAMRKHLRPGQLTVDQLLDIATAEPVPVARLGLEYLRQRTLSPDEIALLPRLADAASTVLGGEIAAYALGIFSAAYAVDPVSRFFDSGNAAVRTAAFAWLASPAGAAAFVDPALYGRLIETPYDDVRLALVADLKARAALPGQTPATLVALWTGVLLNVHRGGRSKLIALRQVSDAVAKSPANAIALLPVLAVAIRSVRPPEARTGLSAIVSAVERSPALAADVGRFLPELQLPVGADWGEAVA